MKRSFLFLLPVLALASCSWFESGSEQPLLSGVPAGCPQVAVIRDLSVYQNPPAANENSLVMTARMGNIRGGCMANSGGVNVDATMDVVAMKGARSNSTHASIPFFVSVLDPHDDVVSKKVYEIPVDFENGATETRVSTPINPQFDIKPGDSGESYRVLIGFHLNPAQIDANTRFFNGNVMRPAAP
ncbi:MAG: hypothetical protein HY053_05665 [Proteobacteria bacterium]|nr:hypothetical protein [Pseudomonadota bacterium]